MASSHENRLEEEYANRSRFKLFYREVETFIQNRLSVQFKNELEFWLPGCENRLKIYSEQLQSGQCNLLFSGQTGSGKSSLINLLLGADVLPTSQLQLQCTATFVEISYGDWQEVTAHYRRNNPGQETPPYRATRDRFQSLDSFVNRVKNMITQRDEATGECLFESVQLKWPAQILKEGVTIVDSPGIDKNELVSPLLSRYLEKSFGLVYVIDSSVPIHKHQFGQLMLKTFEINDGFHQYRPLFICNHWDKVPEADHRKVLDSTKDIMRLLLPEETTIKLCPISVNESAQAVKCGQMARKHTQLLAKLRKFVLQSRKGQLLIYYRFLCKLLKKVLYLLRLKFNTTKETVEHIRRGVIARRANTQRNPEERIEKIKRHIKDYQFDAGCDLLKYLKAEHIRNKMTHWEKKDCPKIPILEKAVKQIEAAIAKRVAQGINMWEKESKSINSLKKYIAQLFKDEFQLTDKELNEVQETLTHGNLRQRLQLEAKELDSPSIWAAITAQLLHNTAGARDKNKFNRRYCSIPPAVMKKATEFYLDSMLCDVNNVVFALPIYFESLLNGISQVGAKVPDLMKADENLLAHLEQELQEGSDRLIQLPAIARECSTVLGNLDMFYVERLLVSDISTDQIKCSYSNLIGSGSFATVYKGTLLRGNERERVALKVPKDVLSRDDVTDVLLEESMLRDMRHSNIVKYYGMFKQLRNNGIRIIFVMEYCPFTLKDKCINMGHSPSSLGVDAKRQKEAIRTNVKYMSQISSALIYLHHKTIVHRDLKPENILLTAQGDVKIADLGLAKRVIDIATCRIGTPAYMAPEVLLLNDKYNTKVDIYSFAMVMWELWYGYDLSRYASMEIQCRITAAIAEGWRPSISIVQAPCFFWSELMKMCWQQDPDRRPTAAQISLKLSQYWQELQI